MSHAYTSYSIRLGLMAPLTGLVGMYGNEIIWAARIAVAEINQQGGVLGRPLELICEDDGSLPATAVPAAKRLINLHGCSAIIGNLLSNSRLAVANLVVEQEKIPYLNFSFYEGSINSRYFFHFAALPNQQIDKMIPYMVKRYGAKMYFAGSNYEWPRGSIDAAKEALMHIEGDIVGEEYLPIDADLSEIDELLTRVQLSGADVFVPYFAGSDQIKLLTRFTELGLKKHMAVVMGHYDEVMMQQLPPHIREGFYSSNTYFMSLDTPENHSYLKKLATMPGVTGIWPNGNGILTNFGEATYLCVHAFAQAVQQAKTTETNALIAALENVALYGPQGFISMDPTSHHACVNTFLARGNQNGTFKIIEQFGRVMPEIPKRYQHTQYQYRTSAPPDTTTSSLHLKAEPVLQKIGAAHHIFSIADMAIITTDENGVIDEANTKAYHLFGYEPGELLGLSVHLLLPPHLRSKHAEMIQRFIEGMESERRMTGRSVLGYRKDGSFFSLEAFIGKFTDNKQMKLVVAMRDISERIRSDEQLLWQTTHDLLTGLPNRSLFRERLTNALSRSRRHGLSLAVLFIDIDGFKLINDTYGHEVGDLLLTQVAKRLITLIRAGDTLARLSGDEFVILCEQLEQPLSVSSLAENINEAMRENFDLGHESIYLTVSIGVAVGHGSTHSTDDLLRSADTAMYEVKQHGRDSWQFFNISLQEKIKQRLEVTQGLRAAIEQKEFSIRLQPIIHSDTGQIAGAELLLRWNSVKGEISPAIFIPIAELTGSIIAIGAWVFAEACRIEVDWRERWGSCAPAYVSVNISARQLSEHNLIDHFEQIIRTTRAEPARILLEITETALMADVEFNLRVIKRLADLGFRLAVDDFGTGYSSLAQLTRLPVSVLKIDKAFIDHIEEYQESHKIIFAIISMAKALGLKLVAEGVEKQAQLSELKALNCDYVQGYLFYRPLYEKDFIEQFNLQQNCRNAANTR